MPEKSRQLLDADTVTIDRVLRPRRNFANDRRRIARLRRMIDWLVEDLEMPVVEIEAAAVRRFGWARVCQHQVRGQRNQRSFQDLQPPLLLGTQIFPAFALCLGVEGGDMLEESGGVE